MNRNSAARTESTGATSAGFYAKWIGAPKPTQRSLRQRLGGHVAS